MCFRFQALAWKFLRRGWTFGCVIAGGLRGVPVQTGGAPPHRQARNPPGTRVRSNGAPPARGPFIKPRNLSVFANVGELRSYCGSQPHVFISMLL